MAVLEALHGAPATPAASSLHAKPEEEVNGPPLRSHPSSSPSHIFSSNHLNLKSSVAGRLRHDAVRCWATTRLHWSLGKHEPGLAEDRTSVFLLLVLCFPCLALVIVAFQLVDGESLLGHVVDHERHGEVVEAVAPRDLHDDVERNEIVASV